MGIFGLSWGMQKAAETALKRALHENGVPAGTYPYEVLREVGAHCVRVAKGAAAFEKMVGKIGMFPETVNLQHQVDYAARLIGGLVRGDLAPKTLQERSPALFDALSNGLAEGIAQLGRVEREI